MTFTHYLSIKVVKTNVFKTDLNTKVYATLAFQFTYKISLLSKKVTQQNLIDLFMVADTIETKRNLHIEIETCPGNVTMNDGPG